MCVSYRGVASWDWYYPYYYAPMASDMTDLQSIQGEWHWLVQDRGSHLSILCGTHVIISLSTTGDGDLAVSVRRFIS